MGTDRPDDSFIDLSHALAILGLPADATPADLRRAFRARARRLHPDAGGDADAFRALKDAYDLARRRGGTPTVQADPQAHVDPYRTWLSELDRCAAMRVPAAAAERTCVGPPRRTRSAERFAACLDAARREVA